MCGAELPWTWFILDVSYALVLLGGATTLRARGSLPSTWVAFGVLSALVGGFLFAATYEAQAAYGNAVAAMSTIAQLSGC